MVDLAEEANMQRLVISADRRNKLLDRQRERESVASGWFATSKLVRVTDCNKAVTYFTIYYQIKVDTSVDFKYLQI